MAKKKITNPKVTKDVIAPQKVKNTVGSLGGRKKTANYYKAGEISKRINRNMLQYKKNAPNSEQFKKVQAEIKALPKEFRTYDRKQKMYKLTTPRKKDLRQELKKIQSHIEESLNGYGELKLVQKFLAVNGYSYNNLDDVKIVMDRVGSHYADFVISYLKTEVAFNGDIIEENNKKDIEYQNEDEEDNPFVEV